MDTIRVDGSSCIRCGRCVKVCPSQIFVQEKAGGPVALSKPENCIVCGHCVAACPTGSVAHAEFPPAKVHPVDYAAMPTPAQVELLMAARRSNRALSQRPVPQEMLDRIVAAADLAPIQSGKKGQKIKPCAKLQMAFMVSRLASSPSQSHFVRQLSQRRSLWQYGKVSGFAKASLHEGGGCEQREQTEGAITTSLLFPPRGRRCADGSGPHP